MKEWMNKDVCGRWRMKDEDGFRFWTDGLTNDLSHAHCGVSASTSRLFIEAFITNNTIITIFITTFITTILITLVTTILSFFPLSIPLAIMYDYWVILQFLANKCKVGKPTLKSNHKSDKLHFSINNKEVISWSFQRVANWVHFVVSYSFYQSMTW